MRRLPPRVHSAALTNINTSSRPSWLLPAHVLGVALLQSTWMAVQFVVPVLARKRFDANDWQTLLITATPTIFFSLSIFWNDLFSRRGFGSYLFIYWLVGCAPLAWMGFAGDYWTLLIPHLITCIGGAGYHPAAGDLFRSLYPEKSHGRTYGILWGASMIFGAVGGYIVGDSLSRSEDAFRFFFVGSAALQLAGVGIFSWLSRVSGHSASRRLSTHERTRLRTLIDPIVHMKDVLRADPVFARYEAAYMTYGVGWMIAYALLPIVVTSKLHLDYDKIANSTNVPYLIAIVFMIWPAGWLMDKLGAVRSTGLSFLLLTIYPLGLIWASDADQLLLVSIVYGVAHAGASVGWMLGPVSLAPSPAKVPQYVAIHATLVGIRGKVFQGLGVLLYSLTDSFVLPLLIAAAAYLWSAWQMWRLNELMLVRKQADTLNPQQA